MPDRARPGTDAPPAHGLGITRRIWLRRNKMNGEGEVTGSVVSAEAPYISDWFPCGGDSRRQSLPARVPSTYCYIETEGFVLPLAAVMCLESMYVARVIVES